MRKGGQRERLRGLGSLSLSTEDGAPPSTGWTTMPTPPTSHKQPPCGSPPELLEFLGVAKTVPDLQLEQVVLFTCYHELITSS